MSQKISQPIIIACRLAIILIWLIKDGGRICVDETFSLYKTLVGPRIILFIYTLILYAYYYLFGGTQVFLGAAISDTVQHLIFVATGWAFYKISQENAISDLFAAVVLNYSVTLLIALSNLGINGVVNYLRAPNAALSSVTTYFEIHGLMFALGILVIYFILFEPSSERHHYLKIIVCLFFIYCGYKRIEFVAIAMAILLFMLLKNKNIRWLSLGGGYCPYCRIPLLDRYEQRFCGSLPRGTQHQPYGARCFV
ncbi:MAG: hypothetical protein LUD00_01000 [Prevotellaceae bacterium]|nr:hypothetical protein [Prevotellaceae bacterium]